MAEFLTRNERDELRASVSRPIAMQANPMTCRAITLLLDERDNLDRACQHMRNLCSKQSLEIEALGDMADAVECLREIGKLVGCDHVDDKDGRRQLVNCVDQSLSADTAELESLRYFINKCEHFIDIESMSCKDSDEVINVVGEMIDEARGYNTQGT